MEVNNQEKSKIIFTEIASANIGLFGLYRNAKTVLEFHQMFFDFMGEYGGNYESKKRSDFEMIMMNLNLINNNLKKEKDGYYYKEHAKLVNKSAYRITFFMDATDYINSKADKKTCLVGIIACLKCGGVVRINGKDYCSLDIPNLKI